MTTKGNKSFSKCIGFPRRIGIAMAIISVYVSICYLMDIPQTDLEKFLQDTEDLAVIHLITSRAVATGQFVKNHDDTKNVHLLNVTIDTEYQAMRLNEHFVPYENVLSWGLGRL
jgi:hypothetical protein